MINWLKEMLNSSSSVSSSRVINFLGAIVGAILLVYETYLRALSPELFGIYMTYCGGIYIGGKYLGGKNDDAA